MRSKQSFYLCFALHLFLFIAIVLHKAISGFVNSLLFSMLHWSPKSVFPCWAGWTYRRGIFYQLSGYKDGFASHVYVNDSNYIQNSYIPVFSDKNQVYSIQIT